MVRDATADVERHSPALACVQVLHSGRVRIPCRPLAGRVVRQAPLAGIQVAGLLAFDWNAAREGREGVLERDLRHSGRVKRHVPFFSAQRMHAAPSRRRFVMTLLYRQQEGEGGGAGCGGQR